jgi:hypothetical protein
MGEDNQPELEETFQEWIDLCDDDEDDEDTSSMEGISDSESGRRTSLNGIHTVHEASNGMASSSHNRVPVHDFRDDTRMVRYRPELEHILPSIESPPRHEQGPQRPSSYHGPQYPPQPILHAAPPPPAPSPPKYRAPPGAFYERHLPQTSMPSLRRVDSDRVVYHPDPARTAPRDYRADVIDLTSSPTFPRTLREADYAPRHLGAPDLPVYATPQQGFLPRAIDMGPLRGGEGNPRDDHRRYEMQEPDNTVHLSNARQVSRVDNGVQPARSAVDGTRPPVYEPFQALQSHSHPLIARNNRNNEMVQQLGNSRLPPPPNMTLDRPHPNVPRTGWVTYTAMTRQGEAVR